MPVCVELQLKARQHTLMNGKQSQHIAIIKPLGKSTLIVLESAAVSLQSTFTQVHI